MNDQQTILQGTPGELQVTMVPVESSNIAAVGYNPDILVLCVRFRNGGSYLYSGVSPEKHAALMAAESKGNYLHKHIKPIHTVTKLEQKAEGG